MWLVLDPSRFSRRGAASGSTRKRHTVWHQPVLLDVMYLTLIGDEARDFAQRTQSAG
jgi:hypothetical protein